MLQSGKVKSNPGGGGPPGGSHPVSVSIPVPSAATHLIPRKSSTPDNSARLKREELLRARQAHMKKVKMQSHRRGRSRTRGYGSEEKAKETEISDTGKSEKFLIREKVKKRETFLKISKIRFTQHIMLNPSEIK